MINASRNTGVIFASQLARVLVDRHPDVARARDHPRQEQLVGAAVFAGEWEGGER